MFYILVLYILGFHIKVHLKKKKQISKWAFKNISKHDPIPMNNFTLGAAYQQLFLCFVHCYILINAATNAFQVNSLWKAVSKKTFWMRTSRGFKGT